MTQKQHLGSLRFHLGTAQGGQGAQGEVIFSSPLALVVCPGFEPSQVGEQNTNKSNILSLS